ncbi:MAG: D-alanyl-lipoteichoic acid biosynthesis protein DltB [Spirochaetota bacterium]
MNPFGEQSFFIMLFAILALAFVLGLFGRLGRRSILLFNLIFIVLIFSSIPKQAAALGLFAVWEYLVCRLALANDRRRRPTAFFWLLLALSIAPLFIAKTSAVLIHRELGFLGVSYLSFRSLQLVIDSWKGSITKLSVADFASFVFFFPTLSSGPIDRSKRFWKDLATPLPVAEYIDLAKRGLLKLLLGLVYKFVFAWLISTYWMSDLPGSGFLATASYMYAYTFYLFFDFAGYSLMAIGTGYILGLRVPDNFRLPFLSRDIKDFWNRWHISLSSWFRDYLYTPTVMALIKGKWMGALAASSIGFAVTMVTMGLWHGRQRHFLAYGSYHAMLLILTDLYQRKSRFHAIHKDSRWYEIIGIFLTFNLICFGMLIFSGRLLFR